jgi:hypothetical protein
MQTTGSPNLVSSVHGHVDIAPFSSLIRATCGACDLTNAAIASMHVLPKGFRRIRHYGLFANGNRAEKVSLGPRPPAWRAEFGLSTPTRYTHPFRMSASPGKSLL